VLAVSPESLAARCAEWQKVVKVWYRVVDYILDPKTHADAIRIMAARVGVSPEEYESFVSGTKILTLAEAKKFFVKGEGFGSLYGSSQIVDEFNRANGVYTDAQAVDAYIDASLTDAM